MDESNLIDAYHSVKDKLHAAPGERGIRENYLKITKALLISQTYN